MVDRDPIVDEGESLYRCLFDLSPLPTALHDGRTIIFANPAGAAVFGFDSPEDLVGRPLLSLVHEESQADVIERTTAMLAGEEVGALVERFVRSDESSFIGEARATPTTYRGSQAVLVIVNDLTETLEAQAEVTRSEESYRQLFEMSPDPTIVHDGETPLLVNHAAVRFLALDKHEGMPLSIWAAMPDVDREHIAGRIREVAESGAISRPMKVTLQALDGTPREAEVTSAPTWWEGQRAVVTVFRDLTQRNLARAELAEIQARYFAVVDQTPIALHFYHLDADEQLIFDGANRASVDMMKVDHAKIAGLPIEEAWPGLAGTDIPEKNRQIARVGGSDIRVVEYDAGDTHGVFESHVFHIGDRSIVAMILDVTERVRVERELGEYRGRLEELVAERTRELDRAHKDIEAITSVAARAVDLRDPYTAGHQRRVAELAYRLALELGLGEEAADRVRIAGQLHDIGKISIPAEILSKPGKLTQLEYDLVKQHSRSAYEILGEVDIGWPLADVVVQHHERMDGTGYPDGLSGDEIMIEVRILSVADVVEAMSSHRPYRPALGMETAAREVQEFSGTSYDPEVVAACVRVIDGGFKFEALA
ncbi:MAG: PAS domain S-box protein [Coriobacteriia bacterium]|nr:PAS domain S-box protein [Coriobacteriia bacterium]